MPTPLPNTPLTSSTMPSTPLTSGTLLPETFTQLPGRLQAGRCQRWDDGRPSWRHPADGRFQPARYRVVPIGHDVARSFVMRHHYSGSFPADRFCFGLTTDGPAPADAPSVEGRALVGVAVLSVPMQARVLTAVFPDLQPYSEALELGRFVLRDQVPAHGESWMLARVHRLAADAGLRGLVSFADPLPRHRERTTTDPATGRTVTTTEVLSPGHVGIIYQACNAIAVGRSTPRTLTYLPQAGQTLSARTLQKIRAGEPGANGAIRLLVRLGARPPGRTEPRLWLPGALADLGAIALRHPGNHRYAWPLGGPATRRRIRIGLDRTPYPKPNTTAA